MSSRTEQRASRRTHLPIAASLFTEQTKLGDFLVRDLSASGALFTHGKPVKVGTSLRVVLVGCGVDGLAVRGTVKRSKAAVDGAASVAVEFDALPPSLRAALEALVQQALAQEDEQAILLVHPKPLVLAALAADVIALGRRVLLATTPLEVVRWLCVADPGVELILVDQTWDATFGREILTLAREEFPDVHAVALGDASSRVELRRALEPVRSVSFLEVPWTPSELKAVLDDGSATKRDEP
jgi:hypothetical protein